MPMIRPALHLWTAAALAATWAPAQAAQTVVFTPGVWTLDTPQAFAADGVLELQLIGQGLCDPCNALLVFQNTVDFAGTLRLSLTNDLFAYAGRRFLLFSYTHSMPSGLFSQIDLSALPGPLNWNTDSLYTSGSVMIQSPSAVPEPAAWMLCLLGAAGLVGMRLARPGAQNIVKLSQ